MLCHKSLVATEICYFSISTFKKNLSPINDKIKAVEVLLVDSDGQKKGLVSIQEALDEAKSSSLDLVQVLQLD